MREIKFRAWNLQQKKMYSFDDLMELRLEFVGTIQQLINEFKFGFEFLQFTGLLDKNGVEIYEGDIVRHTCVKHYVEFIGIVVFEMGCFCIHNKNGKFDSWVFDYDFEVIGNIHENSGLLQ